jgi:hypothetical protein
LVRTAHAANAAATTKVALANIIIWQDQCVSASQPIAAARAALAIWTIWSIRLSAFCHCHAI